MIKKELVNHPFAYFVLLAGVVSFCTLFFWAWPDRNLERVMIGAYAGFYFLWGVLTHRSKQTLTKNLITEYGFVSLLGALLLLMLTF